MEAPFKSQLEIQNLSPETKSYVYQVIQEFEPYTTPNTLVLVVAKDPLKLIPTYEAEGKDIDPKELKTKFRISISLSEDGSKIEEEAVGDSIIEAVHLAKEKLLKVLGELQDNAISSQDRTIQINSILQHTGTIH
jgi:hypothetical protein